MPKVTVQIVTWNAMRFILDCLESLMRQSFRDFSIVIIDNGSEDGTVEFIRSQYPTVTVLQNFKNLGFSKAYNQAIKLSNSEYVLCMNQDVILDDDYLQNLISFADQHQSGASFGGKVLKLRAVAYDDQNQYGLFQSVKSEIIDSTGLVLYKSRKAIDRGEGQKDEGQFNRAEEVFGISGNCVLYRKALLEEAAIKDEYFDNDFFAYKEDIDLAWRLRLYGYTGWYVPAAVCYHHRRMSNESRSLWQQIKNRQGKSKYFKMISFRNQHLMMVKNDQAINILLSLPQIIWRELQIFFYALILERYLFRGLWEFIIYLPQTLLKRRVIMAHRKTSPAEIRKWFR